MYKTIETARKHLVRGENFANKTFDYIRNNTEFAEFAIRKNLNNLYEVGEEIFKNKESVINLLQNVMPELDYSKERFGKSSAIQTFRQQLFQVKETRDVFNDKDVAKSWIKWSGDLNGLSDENRNDKNLFKIALEVRPDDAYNYRKTGEAIKNDYDLTLQAVSQSAYAYEHAPQHLQEDRTIALAAFNNGTSIGHIPEKFKNDPEIFTAALNNDCITISKIEGYFPLLNDKEFIKDYITNYVEKDDSYRSQNGGDKIFRQCGEEVKNDKEIATIFINKNSSFVNYIGEDLLKDREIILLALDQGKAPQSIHKDLSDDREIISKAIKIDSNLLQFASDKLKDDSKLVLEMVEHHAKDDFYTGQFLIRHASERIKKFVGDNDPAASLQSQILAEELHATLSTNFERAKSSRMKI